ncbi:DUF503 domain-containing protein [Myxococcota bacterium]|nr:DUF503 domain-containing protein [Myxococcota bacterium]
MFVVAVARLGFDTSHVTSLKEKRRIRLQITQRIRHRFPVAIAEIESNDDHSRLVLGLAVVSNSSRHAASMMDTVIRQIEKMYIAPMELREREIINLGVLSDPFWTMQDHDEEDWEQFKALTEELHNEQ